MLGPGCAPADFDAISYINEPRWRSSRLGLERIRELMDRLGNPQEKLRFVHVAGTNGKGSTCAFVASILQEAGYKTGLFTSPYIVEFAERIRVNGRNIGEADLRDITWNVRFQAMQMDDHPTEFELMTAVALVYFEQMACDFVVLEVGLGGRLDSTNVIEAPCVCAIAPIAFDHTAVLGNSLRAIAAEKAGIIKSGALVVSAAQEPEAAEMLKAVCSERECALRFVDISALSGTPQSFEYAGQHFAISLLGSYQTENAALAVEVIRALQSCGFDIEDAAIERGLAKTSWPGRFELIAKNPCVIVDGGHNVQGAQALISSLQLNYPGKKAVFLLGVLEDKDYTAMIESLLGAAQAFVCIEPPNPRALHASDLAKAIMRSAAYRQDVPVICADSIQEGLATACSLAGKTGLVCACGSLYSLADVKGGAKAFGLTLP